MELFILIGLVALAGYGSYRAGLREGGTAVSKAFVRGATDNLSSHRQDEIAQVIQQIMEQNRGRRKQHTLFVASAYEIGSAIAFANKQDGMEFEQNRRTQRP